MSKFLYLGRGIPSAKVFPTEFLQQTSTKLLSSSTKLKGHFGTYSDCEGSEIFREVLAEFLSEQYSESVKKEDLIVTLGVTGAVDTALNLFTLPESEIIVEDPTYYEFHHAINNYKLKPVIISSDSDGINTDELEEKLKSKQINPKIMYIVTFYSNPAGVSISQERKIKLIQLAHEYDFYIISDEAYNFLYYSPDTLCKPMALLDTIYPNKVISINTFSKTIMPSLRTGWIISRDQELLKKFYDRFLCSSGGSHCPYATGLLTMGFEIGITQKRMAEMRELYQTRCFTMIKGLDKLIVNITSEFPELKDQIQFHKPSGGYFIWVRLPTWFDSTKAVVTAEKEFSFTFQPGTISAKENGLHSLRLCFARYNEELILDGISRLEGVVRVTYENYLKNNKNNS